MTAFTNALRSEWLKMTSLRSIWIYAVLLVGSVVGPIVLVGLFSNGTTDMPWGRVLLGAGIFVVIAVAFIGANVAGEFDTHMHAHAYLTQDNRHLWLSARLLVNLVFVFVLGAVSVALACAVTMAFPSLHFVNSGGQAIGNYVLNIIVFGLLAMAIAAVTRSRVAAVVIPLVWSMVVEGLLTMAASGFAVATPFWLIAPGVRINQLFSSPESVSGMLQIASGTGWNANTVQPTWFNVLVVVAWIVIAIVVSVWANAKRDVK